MFQLSSPFFLILHCLYIVLIGNGGKELLSRVSQHYVFQLADRVRGREKSAWINRLRGRQILFVKVSMSVADLSFLGLNSRGRKWLKGECIA